MVKVSKIQSRMRQNESHETRNKKKNESHETRNKKGSHKKKRE